VQVNTEPYALKEFLGSGTFSNVYQVEKDNEQFVLKVFKSPSHDTLRDHEERALKTLNTVSVPRFIESRMVNYTNGANLPSIFIQPVGKPIRPLRDGEIVVKMVMFVQVLDALKLAHSLNIVHTDVKPSNMFVFTEAGESKLMLNDWSSCIFLNEESLPRTLGTIGYVDKVDIHFGGYALDLIALVKSAYSCYRHISPPTEDAEATEYWAATFQEGTNWHVGVAHARSCDYDQLETFLRFLS